MTAPPPAHALIDVRLLNLPLDLHERVQAQTDGLLREFRLLLEQSRDHECTVPVRLLALVTEVSERYSGMADEQDQLVEDAVARGELVYPELVFHVPPGIEGACLELLALLDEADAYCRQGQHLLMLATPTELVDYRRWYLQEFVRQLGGQTPTPWPAYRDAIVAREGE